LSDLGVSVPAASCTLVPPPPAQCLHRDARGHSCGGISCPGGLGALCSGLGEQRAPRGLYSGVNIRESLCSWILPHRASSLNEEGNLDGTVFLPPWENVGHGR